MRRRWLFGIATFIVGWLIQVVSLYFLAPASPSPQWLLLAVLALGVMGETNLAQTLGFAWGLCLDAYGIGLFGSQGWILAAMGFLSGRFSRQLNAEKLATQEALCFIGTVFFWIGMFTMEHLFRSPSFHRASSPGALALGFLLNAAAAPVVFWFMDRWTRLWFLLEGRRALFD